MPEVIVYTRAGCHLCDDAIKLLEEHGLTPTQIDIDANAALREQYNDCVPVVTIDGRERFRARVNPSLLRRILRQAGSPRGEA
jgi:glutaredoxin